MARQLRRLRVSPSADPLSRRPRLEALEDRRLLATVTVGNLNDVVNGNTASIGALLASDGGDGISLREAIVAANADNTDAADTINFAAALGGLIQLTNVGHAGEIAISSHLTINGPGVEVIGVRAFGGTAATGDGARIFNVDDGNLGTFKDVAISGLALVGGDVSGAGGAIRNSTENLTLSACEITGNRALSGGGIHNNGGHLSVIRSLINGNTILGSGAGIETLGGSLSVAQSTITGNTTPSGGAGGGVHSSGSEVTIDSSLISGNTANYGGGVTHSGVGVLMTITNSTIHSNRARVSGGGLSVVQGDLLVRHSTINSNQADSDDNGSGNGGGVFVLSAPTDVTIDHTIVAGNIRPPLAPSDVFGAVTARYSLIGSDSGATITNNGGNLIGTVGSLVNPVLEGLRDNGGPTKTLALLPGSPAIDAGDPAVGSPPLDDQRGAPFSRVADGDGTDGARIDIGAYERQTVSAADLVVDTLTDEDDGDYSPGDRSLREAIDAASGSIGAETISFAASLTSGGPAVLLLTQGELLIDSPMTISGPGADQLALDASGNDPTPLVNNGDGSRVFSMFPGLFPGFPEPSDVVTIRGLTLTGGDVAGGVFPSGGGAIFNAGTLVVSDSTISGNSAEFGGGISNYSLAHLTVRDSTISGNTAARFGGGIYNQGATLLVSGSTISDNSVTSDQGEGGGIFSRFDGAVTVASSTISGNSANFSGGGVSFSFSSFPLIVRHSTITLNSVNRPNPALGGGIFLDPFSPPLELFDTIVAGNFRGANIRDDILSDPVVQASYSLIGDATGAIVNNLGGSLIGTPASPINPLLAPLADNGGPTKTHALLAGSPAINAGNPNPGSGGAPQFDQRGAAFSRLVNARMDIGAFESDAVSANFDVDDDVDGFDFLAWQRGFGATGAAATRANGNADGDSDVDGADLAAWRAQFGVAAAALSAAGQAATADAVMGSFDGAGLFGSGDDIVHWKRRGGRRG
jgi:CSLREA domain-containing protein